MSNVTAEMVKKLRLRTGVGMSKCKEALVLAKGDENKAIEELRKSGMSSAVKKEGREAKEGFIGVYETPDAIGLVELNSETDFVAKNEKFVQYLHSLAQQVAEKKPASLDQFILDPSLKDASMTVDQYRNMLIQTFGENIQIRRIEIIKKEIKASYGVYSHMGGKIVCIVEITGDNAQQQAAKDVAMHIAAEDPEYLSKDQVPKEIVQKEEDIAKAQVKNKPENIIDKIVQGKLKAYFDQVCLLGQKFVKDPSLSIQKYIEQVGKTAGKPLSITNFWRWHVGQ